MPSEQATGKAASRLIDQRIRDLGGWRGETLARMRGLILEADPEMVDFARRNERPCRSFFTCASRPADPVNVAFRVLRQVKVDDMRHARYIESASGHIRRNKDIDAAVAEFAHHGIALIL